MTLSAAWRNWIYDIFPTATSNSVTFKHDDIFCRLMLENTSSIEEKCAKKIHPFVACFLGITYLKKEKEKWMYSVALGNVYTRCR